VISFIIPAYNEERLLGFTLRALHAAAATVGEPYEVIVVDDASSDGTSAVAVSHGARVVRVSNQQIATTRNAGARQALGDVFIFVDADTLVDHAVVSAAIAALRSGAVGGGAAFRYEGRIPLYARALAAPVIWVLRHARLGTGCFLFCTRSSFEAVGGFDETLYGAEDIAICRALKRQGKFVVLRRSVTTSGRKLRAHSLFETVWLLAMFALNTKRVLRRRDGPLAIWYDRRRDDPDTRA
jgi:glycosyltransferase involved in cell wall biosynthesis